MDIFTHTLVGLSVGSTTAHFEKSPFLKDKMMLTLVGGCAGAVPDIDAISLWSKFDQTIGKFFSLKHLGKEIYFGKFWYSHHAFFHSFVAAISFSLFFLLLFVLFHRKRKKSKKTNAMNTQRNYCLFFITFFISYLLHLFADMPTPASVWGGVQFFFPFEQYIGGLGYIWWWNNYDIFLIVFFVFFSNFLFLIVQRFFTSSKRIFFRLFSIFPVLVFSLGLALSLWQIYHRPFNFAYQGFSNNYQEFEKQSKKLQKQILQESLFKTMSYLDKKIPLPF